LPDSYNTAKLQQSINSHLSVYILATDGKSEPMQELSMFQGFLPKDVNLKMQCSGIRGINLNLGGRKSKSWLFIGLDRRDPDSAQRAWVLTVSL
jgi:hypothetical protein